MHFPQIHGGLSVKGSPSGREAQPLRHACGVPPPLPRGGLGIAENFSSSPEAPLLGATATTAASGGNREELLGQRPARRKRSAADAGSRNPALSSEARLRGCTKESLSSVGKSGSWHSLYLFGEKSGIMVLRFTPRISRERRWTRWPIFSHFWYLSEQM